jgi:hypothetical protein
VQKWVVLLEQKWVFAGAKMDFCWSKNGFLLEQKWGFAELGFPCALSYLVVNRMSKNTRKISKQRNKPKHEKTKGKQKMNKNTKKISYQRKKPKRMKIKLRIK